MSKSKSSNGGGGYRITENVKSSSIGGGDRSYQIENDYGSDGSWKSGVKTDHNGDQWSLNSIGKTTEKVGNDGRKK